MLSILIVLICYYSDIRVTYLLYICLFKIIPLIINTKPISYSSEIFKIKMYANCGC